MAYDYTKAMYQENAFYVIDNGDDENLYLRKSDGWYGFCHDFNGNLEIRFFSDKDFPLIGTVTGMRRKDIKIGLP